MHHRYYPSREVCTRQIDFDLTDGKIHNLSFTAGCDGNLKAISKLLEGADAEATALTLNGNICGRKSTSCADQLSLALEQALAEERG